ncbi:MAG: hypothetical protein K6B69_13905 [Lachnospiraceae bacterium]|nr:hypothetical protein [Lachnospiraceae bacterium]
MKDREIANQIATIDKLKMVHFYHLFGESGPLCGILAYYQDRVINLCNTDKHFTELFERITKVYEREAAAGQILTDEKTAEILNRANAFTDDAFEAKLSGYQQEQAPMMLPKAFCSVYIRPIIAYVVEALYSGHDPVSAGEAQRKISFDTHSGQWFGKGILDGIRDGKTLHFPYLIAPTAGEVYDILVRNVLADGNALKIEITFGYDRITVSYYDSLCLYEGSLQYRMEQQKGFVNHELRQKGEIVFTAETECPEIDGVVPTERVLAFLAVSAENFSACTLPWGDVVCSASVDGTEYRVMMTNKNDLTISYLLCFRYLTGEEEAPLAFGEYSFRLYERSDITELHLLEMEQPGSGRFQEKYSGKYYK